MKKISIIIVSLLYSTVCFSQTAMNVMTFNIRLDLRSDSTNAWEFRKEMVVDLIRFHKADIIGMQEVLPHQLDYLANVLQEYGVFGVGRDDGVRKGEIMAVFYHTERFDTVSTATYWCSETPEKPGLGWDAAFNRTITWGKFIDRSSGVIFHLFNTHFDHMGVAARKNSATLIRKKIDELTKNDPVIVTGDFNASPDSDPYRTMIGNEGKKLLNDAAAVSRQKHYGPKGTFTGFNVLANPADPIDFIFVSRDVRVERHATLSETVNGRLPSDHYPVLAEIVIANSK